MSAGRPGADRTGWALRRLPIGGPDDRPDGLRRVLGVWQLTAIGLGAIIGVGIFVLTGLVAATMAGPAVLLSFLLAGAVSGAAALCYAEFAAAVPRAGSAYTYAYATLGELAGWIIGWDLLLEYALIVSVVAIGWSGYLRALLADAGVVLPAWAGAVRADNVGRDVDVLAAGAAIAVAVLLSLRTEWGARFNAVVVAIKLAAVALVIGVGVFHVDPRHWHPFLPFGAGGVIRGASVVFFAVFGYDALTAAAEEARDPVRDVPRAVLLSLGIAMALYIAMCAVLTGIVPFAQLDDNAPVAHAFRLIGLPAIGAVVSLGAVAGLTSVMFACLLPATRIFYALSRDGLLPGWFATTHPRFRTPHRPTLILGAVTALGAGLFPIRNIAELVNIGSLTAFLVISLAVPLLRRRRPVAGGFRAPLLPLVSALGAGGSALLIAGLPYATDLRFVVWLLIGLGIYLGYGRRHSRLATGVSGGDCASR